MSNFGEALYELVHRMDKNERRYFKLFTQSLGGKETQTLQLFDALARQKEYSETKLKRKFRGQKLGQHLAVTKQRLYDVIIKGLRNYHDSKTIELEVLERLKNVEILIQKRLLILADRELKVLKNMALKQELSLFMPLIIKQELYVSRWLKHPKNGKFLLQCQELKTAIKQLEKLYPYWETTEKVITATRHQLSFDNQLEQLKKEVEEQEVDRADANYAVYQALAIEAMDHKNWEDALLAWTKVLAVLKQTPYNQSYWGTHRYVLGILNYIETCSYLVDVKAFYEGSKQFEELDLRAFATKAQNSYRYMYLSQCLGFYRKIGALEKGKLAIAEFFKFVEKEPKLMAEYKSTTMLCYYEGAHLLFLSADYELALEYFQQSKTLLKNQQTRIEYQQMILLIELLIYYHLASDILLPNLIRSYDRQLDKTANYYEFAHQMALLLKKLIDLPEDIAKKELLMLSKQELLAIEEHEEWLVYFPFIDWIDSELKGEALAEILSTKHEI